MYRPKAFHIQSIVFLLVWILMFASGCASTPEGPPSSPEKLMADGKRQLAKNSPEDAVLSFKKLLEDFPDSKERVAALILLAQAHYKAKEYDESKFHYTKFIELYPAHQHVDQARYFKAMSDFNLMEIPAKDQAHTQEALKEFEFLIQNFPKSPYRPNAEKKKQECQYKLAKSYFDVGKFYYRTGSYQSAILRFKKFMELYPEQPFIDEAVFLLGEAYYHEQNYEQAKDFYQQLLTQHSGSPFIQEARIRLKTLR